MQPAQVALPSRQLDEVAGQPLVDQHGGVAEHEVVVAEGGELHGVLDQAGAGGEARPRHARHARVVVAAAVEDAVEVDAGRAGDHVELVDGGELDVAPGVGHQLAQLGLDRLHLDELGREAREELAHRRQRLGVEGADDLRQRAELAQAVALRHPLGAEGDARCRAPSRAAAAAGARLVPGKTVLRRIRIWPSRRWSRAAVEHAVDGGEAGVEVLVDRRADDHHQECGTRLIASGRSSTRSRPVGSTRRSISSAPSSKKGISPARMLLDLGAVDVVDDGAQTRVGADQRERQADVAAAADDADVVGEGCRHGGEVQRVPGGRHTICCLPTSAS